ncbi:MAG: hypothetical protein IPO63_17825 [Bacteroidetes bacterium]|nr:hypothetical protein [Bacteroidota bacterium]
MELSRSKQHFLTDFSGNAYKQQATFAGKHYQLNQYVFFYGGELQAQQQYLCRIPFIEYQQTVAQKLFHVVVDRVFRLRSPLHNRQYATVMMQ